MANSGVVQTVVASGIWTGILVGGQTVWVYHKAGENLELRIALTDAPPF